MDAGCFSGRDATMVNLWSWAARLLTRLFRPRPFPSRAPHCTALRLEELTDRVLPSAGCWIVSLPEGAASDGNLFQAWSEHSSDGNNGSPAPVSSAPTLLLRDGTTTYRLTELGKDTLQIAVEDSVSAGESVIPAHVSFRSPTVDGDQGLRISVGSSAQLFLVFTPVDTSAPGFATERDVHVHELSATLDTALGRVVVHIDFDHHETRESYDGKYSWVLQAESTVPGLTDHSVGGVTGLGQAEPGGFDGSGAAILALLSGAPEGAGTASELDSAGQDTLGPSNTGSEVFVTDSTTGPNPLTIPGWTLPDARAELAPLQTANQAVASAFIVEGTAASSARERPLSEDLPLAAFVTGLGTAPSALPAPDRAPSAAMTDQAIPQSSSLLSPSLPPPGAPGATASVPKDAAPAPPATPASGDGGGEGGGGE
jgi:hypothetical protein